MSHSNDNISFVTFGMFIIDEIEWQTPEPPPSKTNLIGGAGTYAVLGARLAASPSQSLSHTVSWIVDVGSDFPPEVKSTINTWNTNCIFRYDSTRLTTRAWNGYGANDLRAFKYLTPKVRLEVSSLNPAQIMAKSFHMVCSPDRCIDITTKLREARRAIDPTCQNPVVIWEPIPDLCSPEELFRLQEAARNCTVVSPNHDELKMFFQAEIASFETQEQLVKRLMGWNTEENQQEQCHSDTSCSNLLFSNPAVLIREGSNGSTAYFHPLLPNPPTTITSETLTIHLPAYHTSSTAHRVTDPTGGGNTYLGALALSLGLFASNELAKLPAYNILERYIPITTTYSQPSAVTVPMKYAMIIAIIAASFAIEQNGTPKHTHADSGEEDVTKEREYWNGETMEGRLASYIEREKSEITSCITSNGSTEQINVNTSIRSTT